MPSSTSGVTIGRGYDLGRKKKRRILADMREAGIAESLAKRFAAAAGLRGGAARDYISSHLADVEITPEQQRALFELTYRDLEEDVIRLCTKADVVEKYGTGLGVAAENIETLIEPARADRQLLASAVSALARGLSDELAGGARVRELLSRRQLISLSGLVFEEVARHPEQLLGAAPGDAERTALAQIIGSVAASLGDDPGRLTNGEGLLELIRLALRAGIRNADKLLDLESGDPSTNLLFEVVHELASEGSTARSGQGFMRPLLSSVDRPAG